MRKRIYNRKIDQGNKQRRKNKNAKQHLKRSSALLIVSNTQMDILMRCHKIFITLAMI